VPGPALGRAVAKRHQDQPRAAFDRRLGLALLGRRLVDIENQALLVIQRDDDGPVLRQPPTLRVIALFEWPHYDWR
jgi:hypothetical protein